MHSEHGIEQIRQPNAVRLGDEPEEAAVAVEAPGPALLNDFQARLVVAVQEDVGDAASGILVGQLDGLGAEPLDVHDGDETVGQDAADGGVGPEVEPLLKSIDRLVDRNRASGLRGFGVLLSSEPLRDASRVQTFAFDAKIAMPLTVATEAVAGPSCQRVHPDAAVTVIVYEKRRVEANFSYRAGELDGDAVREIVDTVAHLAGGNKAD